MKVERNPNQEGATVQFALDECDAFIKVARDAQLAGVDCDRESLDYLHLSVRLGATLENLTASGPQATAAVAAPSIAEPVSREDAGHAPGAAADGSRDLQARTIA